MSSEEPIESESRRPAGERPESGSAIDASGMMRSLKPLLDALIRERLRIESLLDEARTVSEQLQRQLDAAATRPMAAAAPAIAVSSANIPTPLLPPTPTPAAAPTPSAPADPAELRGKQVQRVARMCRDGATVAQIAAECAIPTGEAELIIRLLRTGELRIGEPAPP